MAGQTLVALVVFLLAVAALVVLLTTYNSVVAMQRRIDKAWANVDVALKQRHDELPNLVEAVRGEMSYERSVLEDVASLRAAYSPDASLPAQAVTSDATSSAVRSLLAVIERYPSLRSQENVMGLQREIERLETLIATRREFFNDSVYLYDSTIRQMPAVLFASLMGWAPRDFFAAPGEERARPDVAMPPAG
jgi:LemA protein